MAGFPGHPGECWHGGEDVASRVHGELYHLNRVVHEAVEVRDTKILEEPVSARVIGEGLPVVIGGLVASPANHRRRHSRNVVPVVGIDAVDVLADLVAIGQYVNRDGNIGVAGRGYGYANRAGGGRVSR